MNKVEQSFEIRLVMDRDREMEDDYEPTDPAGTVRHDYEDVIGRLEIWLSDLGWELCEKETELIRADLGGKKVLWS